MYCKNCGQKIPENAAFCPFCGTPHAQPQQPITCAACGQPVPLGAASCPYCGTPLLHSEQSQEQPSQSEPSSNYYPPQPPYPQNYPTPPYEQKSRVAAGILGILLGAFGVHNFYLGFTGKAVAQLLITVCTCGIGATVSGIWGLVEGIMILTQRDGVDAKGIPLRD